MLLLPTKSFKRAGVYQVLWFAMNMVLLAKGNKKNKRFSNYNIPTFDLSFAETESYLAGVQKVCGISKGYIIYFKFTST